MSATAASLLSDHKNAQQLLTLAAYLKEVIPIELADGRGHTHGVAIKRTDWNTANFRVAIQQLGEAHGCHSCGTVLSRDADQPWVGDHIPPTNLHEAVRKALGLPEARTLYPQCYECSNQQSALVRGLAPGQDLSPGALRLLKGGKLSGSWGGSGVASSGENVSAAEGVLIQALGIRHGCHTCGATVPTVTYIADHIVPQCMTTSYAEYVFGVLGIPYPQNFYLRPQCPKCSTNQGGTLSKVNSCLREFYQLHSGKILG